MYTVYMHVNKINNKKYIGITRQKPQERWGNNGINYKESPRFYASIQKYGWNNFQHIILFEGLSKEQACEKEIELIKKYKTQIKEFGYNIQEGGSCPEMPQEVREKISKALMGNKNGQGHPCSEEKKKKISEAQKGRSFTEEHKQKLSQAAKNRHVPCSEEKKQKLRQSYPNKKPVYCIENDTIYSSVQECARELSLFATAICKVCKNKMKTTGGLHFRYYDDTINA